MQCASHSKIAQLLKNFYILEVYVLLQWRFPSKISTFSQLNRRQEKLKFYGISA